MRAIEAVGEKDWKMEDSIRWKASAGGTTAGRRWWVKNTCGWSNAELVFGTG